MNADHVPLRFGHVTNYNPIYLRNALVDMPSRAREEKSTMSTDVAVPASTEVAVPVATSKFRPVVVPMDHLADFYRKLVKARSDMKQLKAFIEGLEAVIKEDLTSRGATDGTIKGATIVTYRPKESFRLAEFRDDHPEIYAEYLVPTTSYVLDRDALLACHAGLLEDYRSSAFTVK